MLWVLVAVAVVILILLLVQYNTLVYLRQLMGNAWSDVDVYLKRRAELIPNLVTAVKAYAGHDKTVLEALAQARADAVQLKGPTPGKAAAESQVGSGIVQALILAENYPDLKASDQFLNLQNELSDTEKLIANARQYFNAVVRDYNTKVESFPSNVVAGMMALKPAEFFETDTAEEREVPRIADGS